VQLENGARREGGASLKSGILPSQALRELIGSGQILSAGSKLHEQVQPASLDLALGTAAYRIRASFLPGPQRSVAQRIDELAMHRIDLSRGAVLEAGCVYIVPLQEEVRLDSEIAGMANPKSSTGRLNVFTRLIVDGASEFDTVPAGYQGPLYAEIAPNAFSILVHQGTRLNQLRLRRGSPNLGDVALEKLHEEVGLLGDEAVAQIRRGLVFTVDLEALEGGPVGYRAKRHTGVIDLQKIAHYDPRDFWEPLAGSRRHDLILDPNEFYILASRESVRIPPSYAAEMIPYDTQIGEFRVHYAGFFDPGFGWKKGGAGTRAVLEVRSHEVPFILEHGQAVGRLVYEELAAEPDQLYGAGIGSSYHSQGLTLSKHFRPWSEA